MKGVYGDRNWTDEQVEALEDHLRRGWSDAQIAKIVHRTPTAIQIYRKRHGLGSVTEHTLNCHKVGRLLGKDNTVVIGWCERGWMRASHSGVARGANRQWIIDEDELLRFLAAPENWMLWRPETITDLGLREWALELPRYRWHSPGDVARWYCVRCNTVSSWIRKGLLPAVRRGNYWIADPSLDGFEPPFSRSKAGSHARRFQPHEDASLITMRAAGVGWTEIADALARSVSSVFGRWERLAERRVEEAS